MSETNVSVQGLVVQGFKQPIPHEIVESVSEMWDEGFNRDLIAEANRISVKKVSAILAHMQNSQADGSRSDRV